jgi:hypothetical protein
MVVFANIGAKALYLLFIWLISAAGAAWLAERKGYGERLGLTFGLILTFVGFIIVALLPGRPGSAWRLEGPFPRRGRGRAVAGTVVARAPEVSEGPALGGDGPQTDASNSSTAPGPSGPERS